jgi:hypothetical protein
MDEFAKAKLAGAKIFRAGAKYIIDHGWNHNSMDTLLAVTLGKPWPQPMAVLMFSELEHALGHQTLTQFDQTATRDQALQLFETVASSLTTSN